MAPNPAALTAALAGAALAAAAQLPAMGQPLDLDREHGRMDALADRLDRLVPAEDAARANTQGATGTAPRHRGKLSWPQPSDPRSWPRPSGPLDEPLPGGMVGFVGVKVGARCGTHRELLAKGMDSAEACARRVASRGGAQAFSLGQKGVHAGWCYAEGLHVDGDLLREWREQRDMARCPVGWEVSADFDFFALELAEENTDITDADMMRAVADANGDPAPSPLPPTTELSDDDAATARQQFLAPARRSKSAAALHTKERQEARNFEREQDYLLIRENAECGTRGQILSRDVEGADQCAELARGAGAQAFALGIKFVRGRCYAEGLQVTKDVFESFERNRKSPPCPAGDWAVDELYDFYALAPEA